MSLRQRPDEAQQRALLFGAHHRRVATPNAGVGTTVASLSERESLEAGNEASVDGLRGRVGEMRHVSVIATPELEEETDTLSSEKSNGTSGV